MTERKTKPTCNEIKTAATGRWLEIILTLADSATDDDDDFGFRVQVLTALITVHQDKGQLKFAQEPLSQMRSAFLDRGLPWREANGTVTRKAAP